ncbi:MAG: HDOD domain-containing protein [Verrucomicrobia bacterium]|nr:HDOD domain-containing protein [Verrucomicrobiota bacterium]
MTTRKRILFVDDEEMVLQGLRRMLRPLREEWDMEFVESGVKALELMAQQPFDVIIADMRMPGMNGAELLNEVMRRHPQTVRFILSGQAEKDLIMKCIGATHQYLAKPCEPDALKATVARTTSLDFNLTNERVRALVSRIDRLPSLPSLYLELNKVLADDQVSTDQIGNVIGKDIAMTGQVLKIVNSAFFGLRREITTPDEAASYLGADILKALVLVLSVFSQFDKTRVSGFSIEELWHHSMEVAAGARLLARCEKADNIVVNESFTAGILHQAGQLVLVSNFPDEYAAVLLRRKNEGLSDIAAERVIFGTTHIEVGGYLFGLWGLPVPIVEAIGLHHQPMLSPERRLGALTTVHVANALLTSGVNATAVDEAYLQEAGLLDRLPEWKSQLESSQSKIAA